MAILIGEVGINANGDIEIAKKLIDVAASAGLDYVKFQKRTPELCVPEAEKSKTKDTPWGVLPYLEYKRRIEFGRDEYDEIHQHCKTRGIKWTASVWDRPSLHFIESYAPDFIKIPSAFLTDHRLLEAIKLPVLLSTGMSTIHMVDDAVAICDKVYGILHCTSTYPSKTSELNLNCIPMLKERYPKHRIGFSNHHPGLIYMPAAVALGAKIVEFHITLDRAMWGTDQAASIEPEGVYRLAKWINGVEEAMGDGVKRIYDSEIPIMKKLRVA